MQKSGMQVREKMAERRSINHRRLVKTVIAFTLKLSLQNWICFDTHYLSKFTKMRIDKVGKR